MIRRNSILFIIAVALSGALLFVPVKTKQGVNYTVYTYHIPLYIKIIEFIDRDYHYRRIIKEILPGKATPQEKALALLAWCSKSIHDQPGDLPVMDDHPLFIVIRGYGIPCQFEDIFTVLCAYAGLEAFSKKFVNSQGRPYYVSFIKVGDSWSPVTAYRNVHVLTNGRLVTMDEVQASPLMLQAFVSYVPNFETSTFLRDVKEMRFSADSIRARGQSPCGRITCLFKELISPDQIRSPNNS